MVLRWKISVFQLPVITFVGPGDVSKILSCDSNLSCLLKKYYAQRESYGDVINRSIVILLLLLPSWVRP